MNYNWQAYLDGSLDAQEVVRHDQALAHDKMATAQLNSLRAFQAAIRDACLESHVPDGHLDRLLRSATRPAMTWRQASTAAVAVAAVACAALFVAIRVNSAGTQWPIPSAGVAQRLVVSNPVAAQVWMASISGAQVPTLDKLGKRCTLISVEADGGQVAWNLTYKGTPIRMTEAMHTLPTACHPTIKNGKSFEVDANSVSWNIPIDTRYSITGGTAETRMEIAEVACDDTAALNAQGS